MITVNGEHIWTLSFFLMGFFLLFCGFFSFGKDDLVDSNSRAPVLPYFMIKVVDEETGRGIPCVKLTTTSAVEYWTDSAGVVAFYEPELMDKDVYFHVESFGYSYLQDAWFGFRGVRLRTKPGSSALIKMKRENIAQRLYRITGEGIYRDSMLLGLETPPTHEPGKLPVMGQDGGLGIIYKGKMFWIWGDTQIARFPLGVFRTVCATSDLPSRGGLDPEVGILFNYFRNEKGEVRPMVNLELKPIWLMGPRVIFDEEGNEHLFANYVNGFEGKEKGVVKFNDETQQFDRVCTLPLNGVLDVEGNAFRYEEDGVEQFFFAWNWGTVRSRTDMESVCDMSNWEAFTCLKEGSHYDGSAEQLDRDENGKLHWGWKKNTSPIREKEMRELVKAGHMKPEEEWYQLTDVETGKRIQSQSGTIYWNDYRKRWISIRSEIWGDSMLGEVWYFEGDTPLGPWVYGQKIVTHFIDEKNTYSFYLPAQHPEFDKDGRRVIFFEGTYTVQFSNAPHKTPRYEYNQMMYKLELDDPRLFLPAPVYLVDENIPSYRTRVDIADKSKIRNIAFFAPERPRAGTAPIYEYVDREHRTCVLTSTQPSEVSGGKANPIRIAFYGIMAVEDLLSEKTPNVAPLNEFIHEKTQKRIYTTENSIKKAGYRKTDVPVCRVWKNPILFNPYKLGTNWKARDRK